MRLWIQGILYVTLSDDPKVPNNLNGGSTKHIVLDVCQCLTRGNHDGLPRVYAKRVYVLHVTDLDKYIKKRNVESVITTAV